MGPSYNDSFGSFSSGGTSGGVFSDSNTSINKGNIPKDNSDRQDVVLSSGSGEGRKSSKKLVILLVVLVLCFVGVGLAAMLVLNKPASSGNGKFDELKKYIEVGDGSGKSDDLIYAVAISDGSQEKIAEYYKELVKKEEEFFASLETENAVFDEYKVALRVLRDKVDYPEVETELIDAYSSGGTSGVEEYINKNLSCDGVNSDLKTICESNKKYFEMIISKHTFFDKVGCYISNNYVIDCAIKKYGEDSFFEKFSELDFYNGNPSNLMNETEKKTLSDGIIQLTNNVMEVLKNA